MKAYLDALPQDKPCLGDVLVVSDMDGTLLGADMELPACNLEMIRLFVSLGGHFTVATGRTSDSLARYGELAQIIEPAITAGGCVIYDFREDRPLKSALLPRLVAKKAVKDVLAAFPDIGAVILAADGRSYLAAASPEAQKLIRDENYTYYVRSPEDLPPDWNKVLFAHPPELAEELVAFSQRQPYPGVYFIPTGSHYFEMLPEGVTKGSALRELCAHLKLAVPNSVAIGDYYNDLEMMQTAGLAVAMNNAPREIKLAADEVTGSAADGGVAQFLYKLIRAFEC